MQAAVCRICRCAERDVLFPSPFLKSLCLVNKEALQRPEHDRGADANDLLAPCRCRGTMRWVHRGCLEEWRRASAPDSDSFLRCDMCKTEYSFHCKKWQKVLGGRPAVLLYSLLVCATLVFGAILVAAECRTSLDDILPIFEVVETTTTTTATATTGPQTAASTMVLLIDSVFSRHLFLSRVSKQGIRMAKDVFTGLAALSLLQLLIVDGSVGLSFNLMFSLWRLVHYDFTLDYFLSAAFIAFGMWRMAREVHRVTRMLTTRLLTLKLANWRHDKQE